MMHIADNEESRREQARLQEELVMREKALRDTCIRTIHEMEKLTRAQEVRVDELILFAKTERKSCYDTGASSLHRYSNCKKEFVV